MNQFKISKNWILLNKETDYKTLFRDKKFLLLSFCLLCSTFLIQFLNHHSFHFIGNNYLNQYQFAYLVGYSLIYIVASKLLPELKFFELRFVLILQVLVTTLIAILVTNAIQLTPYSPIDHTLLQYELFPLEKSVVWTRTHPEFHQFLFNIYQSLSSMMYILPFLLCLFKKTKEVNQYCLFLLSSITLGFGIYFFYPSCGPASVLNPSIFLDMQHANHIKFWEIHHYQTPSTIDGGLIAFPSFHVIWAWGCARSFRTINKFLYYLMTIWFVILSFSCFLLGWHYSVDILGSLVLILLLEKLLNTKKPK